MPVLLPEEKRGLLFQLVSFVQSARPVDKVKRLAAFGQFNVKKRPRQIGGVPGEKL